MHKICGNSNPLAKLSAEILVKNGDGFNLMKNSFEIHIPEYCIRHVQFHSK